MNLCLSGNDLGSVLWHRCFHSQPRLFTPIRVSFFRYNGALRYHSIVSAITLPTPKPTSPTIVPIPSPTAPPTRAVTLAYDSTDTITNSAADARAVTLAYDITFGCTYSFAILEPTSVPTTSPRPTPKPTGKSTPAPTLKPSAPRAESRRWHRLRCLLRPTWSRWTWSCSWPRVRCLRPTMRPR